MLRYKISPRNMQHWVYYYYPAGWGFPVLCTIITLAASEYSFEAPNSICFMPADNGVVWFQYALWYIPIGITIAISVFMIGHVLSRLIKSRISILASMRKHSKRPYFKVLYIAICYLGVYLLLFCGRFSADSKKDELTAAFLSWIQCHLIAYVEGTPYTVCGEVPPKRISMNILMSMYVAISIHGCAVFLVFCFDPDLYVGWTLLYTRAYNRYYGITPKTLSKQTSTTAGGSAGSSKGRSMSMASSASAAELDVEGK